MSPSLLIYCQAEDVILELVYHFISQGSVKQALSTLNEYMTSDSRYQRHPLFTVYTGMLNYSTLLQKETKATKKKASRKKVRKHMVRTIRLVC